MKQFVFVFFAAVMLFAAPVFLPDGRAQSMSYTGIADKSAIVSNTIEVSGTGLVMAQPDMARVRLFFTHTSATTQEAKSVVAKVVRQVQDILNDNKVEVKDVRTISFGYDVEYDYSGAKRRRVGQRATQTIDVLIKQLDCYPDRLVCILDAVAAIGKVEVQDVQFDIENKEELYAQSRVLAYNKAYGKATQYAELAHRSIVKVRTISEYSSQDVASPTNRSNKMMLNIANDESADFVGGASLPFGEQGVKSTVYVVFEMGEN